MSDWMSAQNARAWFEEAKRTQDQAILMGQLSFMDGADRLQSLEDQALEAEAHEGLLWDGEKHVPLDG